MSGGNDFPISVHVLDNGLRVLCLQIPHIHSVSIGLWIQIGSMYEPREHAGISHFLEHLFFKGTTTRSARDLMEAVEGTGGQLNAFTTRDATCLYARTLSQHAFTVITILSDIIRNSTFHDFEKERNVVLEEILSIEDIPEEYIHDLLMEYIWPHSALGRPVSGYVDTVSKLSKDTVFQYFHERYTADKMVLSIAGNFPETELVAHIEKEFKEIPFSHSLPVEIDMPDFFSGIKQVKRPIGQAHLAMAIPSVSVNHPDRYTWDVLNNSLGGSTTSRLFEQVREQQGLAYSIYSFRSGYKHTGMMGIYAAVSPENLMETIDIIGEEIRKIKNESLSKKELSLNKEQLKGAFLISLENSSNCMTRMAKSVFYHDRVVPVEEVVQGIDTVTEESVQRVAMEAFSTDNYALVILGPDICEIKEIAL